MEFSGLNAAKLSFVTQGFGSFMSLEEVTEAYGKVYGEKIDPETLQTVQVRFADVIEDEKKSFRKKYDQHPLSCRTYLLNILMRVVKYGFEEVTYNTALINGSVVPLRKRDLRSVTTAIKMAMDLGLELEKMDILREKAKQGPTFAGLQLEVDTGVTSYEN